MNNVCPGSSACTKSNTCAFRSTPLLILLHLTVQEPLLKLPLLLLPRLSLQDPHPTRPLHRHPARRPNPKHSWLRLHHPLLQEEQVDTSSVRSLVVHQQTVAHTKDLHCDQRTFKRLITAQATMTWFPRPLQLLKSIHSRRSRSPPRVLVPARQQRHQLQPKRLNRTWALCLLPWARLWEARQRRWRRLPVSI